jgi:hypothetical protein
MSLSDCLLIVHQHTFVAKDVKGVDGLLIAHLYTFAASVHHNDDCGHCNLAHSKTCNMF